MRKQKKKRYEQIKLALSNYDVRFFLFNFDLMGDRIRIVTLLFIIFFLPFLAITVKWAKKLAKNKPCCTDFQFYNPLAQSGPYTSVERCQWSYSFKYDGVWRWYILCVSIQTYTSFYFALIQLDMSNNNYYYYVNKYFVIHSAFLRILFYLLYMCS